MTWTWASLSTLSLVVKEKGLPPCSQALNHLSKVTQLHKVTCQAPGLQGPKWELWCLLWLYVWGAPPVGRQAAEAPQLAWGGVFMVEDLDFPEGILNWGAPC